MRELSVRDGVSDAGSLTVVAELARVVYMEYKVWRLQLTIKLVSYLIPRLLSTIPRRYPGMRTKRTPRDPTSPFRSQGGC